MRCSFGLSQDDLATHHIAAHVNLQVEADIAGQVPGGQLGKAISAQALVVCRYLHPDITGSAQIDGAVGESGAQPHCAAQHNAVILLASMKFFRRRIRHGAQVCGPGPGSATQSDLASGKQLPGKQNLLVCFNLDSRSAVSEDRQTAQIASVDIKDVLNFAASNKEAEDVGITRRLDVDHAVIATRRKLRGTRQVHPDATGVGATFQGDGVIGTQTTTDFYRFTGFCQRGAAQIDLTKRLDIN